MTPAEANELANRLAHARRFTEAERLYREAVRAAPADNGYLVNLANLCTYLGRIDEAKAIYRACIARRPGYLLAHHGLQLALQQDPSATAEGIAQAARAFGEAAMAAAGGPLASRAARQGKRPLAVGFVSGDLRSHSVGHFLEAWLPHIDRSRLRLHAFPTVDVQDALTMRIRPAFHGWTPLHGMADEAAARAVHAAGIDVLFDLSGHTAHNRLGAFAWRPAPVQVSWLGYIGTTGLPTMDWVLTHRWCVPEGHDAEFTERVWRMQGSPSCLMPPVQAPAPVRAPGPFTFGCFQHLGKVGDGVLGAWAEVLRTVAHARLRVQNWQVEDAGVREQFLSRASAHGVDLSRLDVRQEGTRAAHLASYCEVDVMLDTFPYPGGTTTCEALWMGVPTITLERGRMIERIGAATMRLTGLGNWVAGDVPGYVAKARDAARAQDGLRALRASMRDEVARSPLFDAPAFARGFMDAVEGMAAG